MSRGRKISEMLLPLRDKPIQAYLGNGMHTLGLLRWILEQTGKADVWVSSYSTSEPFLNGFAILKREGKVDSSMILLDQRASKKTMKLKYQLFKCFDNVFLGQNHSKIILVRGDSMVVSVITSQNQTYGARAESSIITTDTTVFGTLIGQYIDQTGKNAVELELTDFEKLYDELPEYVYRRTEGCFDGFSKIIESQINGKTSGDGDGSCGKTGYDSPVPGADWRPIGV